MLNCRTGKMQTLQMQHAPYASAAHAALHRRHYVFALSAPSSSSVPSFRPEAYFFRFAGNGYCADFDEIRGM